ncbi:tRNA(Met) cytidine acetyltransferase TmcA [Leminorella grimontii]|uniref:tRNA(Met) cytidine acetyltransferase TmcA n=1 Tax=Leminorella grimontii TaxID=82981 RepID=UPI0021C445FC|nr:GNAT family N-acetyltransferase [Leminorella grimontii]
MHVDLSFHLNQMQACGIRRLLVLSGDAAWLRLRVDELIERHGGDWLWVSEAEPKGKGVKYQKPSSVNRLLGTELRHAVIDATRGFHAEAFAAVSGLLAAGSLLVVLTPEWEQWASLPDEDSLRWSDGLEPIATPNFVERFRRCVNEDADVMLWRQPDPFNPALLTGDAPWQAPNGQPTPAQQNLLSQLLCAEKGNYVLLADRGRGKSAVAGMLAERWQGKGECWLTAPAKASVETLLAWGKARVRFFSPDALLALCGQTPPDDVDWLIVDEAAAIPAPLLYRLASLFPRVMFTTTVQGYEGSGRGFLLKFCAGLSDLHLLHLEHPIRWAQGDPLERFTRRLLLMDVENTLSDSSGGSYRVEDVSRSQLVENEGLLEQYYGLLTSAHYRTSPLDLRRLLDAPDMTFSIAKDERGAVIAALWLVDEGGLSPELARDVWAGRRRPRGNLVAQSLAAHGSEYQAARLRSARVSRIAVLPSRRRRGVAKALIEAQIKCARARGLDYLSVSFGYIEPLWAFWQACGFELVHMGSHPEASSGCCAAMAIVPFTQEAKALARRAKRQFLLNQLTQCSGLRHIGAVAPSPLDEEDWRELAGFAFAHRSVLGAQVALYRLLRHREAACPSLRQLLDDRLDERQIIERFALSGRKSLIQGWRDEVASALAAIDGERCNYWQAWATGLTTLEH